MVVLYLRERAAKFEYRNGRKGQWYVCQARCLWLIVIITLVNEGRRRFFQRACLEIIACQALCKFLEALLLERFLDFALAREKSKERFKARCRMAQAGVDGDRPAMWIVVYVLNFEVVFGCANRAILQSQ